jgi:hypothetical protein
MGAADGGFDVQKYEIDERIISADYYSMYGNYSDIYTRCGITNGVSSKLNIVCI